MHSNTSSPEVPPGLEALAAAVAEFAGHDPAGLPDSLLAEQTLAVQRLRDQLDGLCLRLLAHLDGRGAAGADQGGRAPSTAGWLRAGTPLSHAPASPRGLAPPRFPPR